MKNTFITTLLSLSFLIASAQSFSESMFMDYEYDSGTYPSLHIHFSNVGKKVLYEAIKNSFKEKNGKIESVKNANDEYLVPSFLLENNIPSHANITILEENSQSDLIIAFKNDKTIISEQQTVQEIQVYKDFAKSIAKKAVNLEVDKQLHSIEKSIKKKKKEIDHLESQVTNYKKKIQNSEHAIEGFHTNISTLEKEITSASNNTIQTNKQLNELKHNLRQKSEKELKKNIHAIEKNNEKLSKTINTHKVKIAELNGEIVSNNTLKSTYEVQVTNIKSKSTIDKSMRKTLKGLNKTILNQIEEIEVKKNLILNEESSIHAAQEKMDANKVEIASIKSEIDNHNESGVLKEIKFLKTQEKQYAKQIKQCQQKISKHNKRINQEKNNILDYQSEIEKTKQSIATEHIKLDEMNQSLKKTEGKKISL